MKEKFKWRKYDYYWIIGILIGIIVIICSIRLSDNSDVVNIISLIASCASICLAFVAIGQSSVNNSQSSDLYQKMVTGITTIESNTNELNNQLRDIKETIAEDISKTIDKTTLPENQKLNLIEAVDDVLNTKFVINSNHDKIYPSIIYSGYALELIVADNFEMNKGEYNLLQYNQDNDKGIDFILENNINSFVVNCKSQSSDISKASEYNKTKRLINMLKSASDEINNKKKKYPVVIMGIGNECKISIMIDEYTTNRKTFLISQLIDGSINLVQLLIDEVNQTK